MEYVMSFLEGIITFISPCLLPMIPIYLSYFAGQNLENRKKVIQNSCGFILGFTLVFIALGAFAGTVGMFLKQYQQVINIIFGSIMILFGLNFMGVLKLKLFSKQKQMKIDTKQMGFFSAVLFGIIFSVSWSPCIGTFLGSALMLAATKEHIVEGSLMLLSFSIGLGIPFLISAILTNQLKSTFDWIKKHYKIINQVSGLFLVLIGILMMTGLMRQFLFLMTK